jgi:hypothetical protein
MRVKSSFEVVNRHKIIVVLQDRPDDYGHEHQQAVRGAGQDDGAHKGGLPNRVQAERWFI